jgi:hypothetical protein
LAIAAGCALLGLATPGQAREPSPGDPQPTCPPDSCTATWVPAEWQVLDVSRDRQALKLVSIGGGCLLDTPRISISETRSRIAMSVSLERLTPTDPVNPQFVCPADRQYLVRWVRLSRILGGRRIDGGPHPDEVLLNRTEQVGNRSVPLAPRVLGLMGRDAAAVLKSQGFKTLINGNRSGRVVWQSRRPGAPAPHGLIRLRTVGPLLLPEP